MGPISFVAGPLDGVHELVSGTKTLCWVPHVFILLLALSRLFSYANLPSVLGEARKNWASWAASHMGWKAGCSLHAHFLLWEKLWAKCIFLGTEMCYIRGRMILGSKIILPILFTASILDVFALIVWWAPTKLLSSVSGYKIQCSCEGQGWELKTSILTTFWYHTCGFFKSKITANNLLVCQ